MTTYDKIIEGALIAAILLFLGLFLTGLIGKVILEPKRCAAQADRMGMQHEFNYVSGCMIEARPGVWVPMNNYRAEDGRV